MWGEHVWRWWCELQEGRGAGAFGPAPISFQDIAAWSALTETATRPIEVRLLMEIDREWLKAVAEQRPKGADR